MTVFLYHLVGLIDIYLIWQILLIILGVRLSTGLTKPKLQSGSDLNIQDPSIRSILSDQRPWHEYYKAIFLLDFHKLPANV
jgi:hypothetical protein